MYTKENFYEDIKKLDAIVLVTSCDEKITMKVISPVLYENYILFFTNKNSTKYKQLMINNKCSVSLGQVFADCEAIFCGSTMLDTNKDIRKIYEQKFTDAFNSESNFNGINSDFILLKPTCAYGWEYDKSLPKKIPTIMF